MVVEIVEPNLAPSDDPWMFGQFCQLIEMLGSDFFRLVRMDAHCRVNPIVLFGKRNGGVELPRTRAGAVARSVVTPAARARSSMASRSSANCGKSICACESMSSIRSKGLLQ